MEDRRPNGMTRGPGINQPESVRVWLLGGFKVSVGSRTIEASRWRLRKAASLVKLLALLWPDLDARSASNNLHRALHFARKALDPAAAKTTSRRLARHQPSAASSSSASPASPT